MNRSKHFILEEMEMISEIPDDFLSEGDTASGTIEGERVTVRCVEMANAIAKGLEPARVGPNEKFAWAILSDDDVCRLESSLKDKDVINYTVLMRV